MNDAALNDLRHGAHSAAERVRVTVIRGGRAGSGGLGVRSSHAWKITPDAPELSPRRWQKGEGRSVRHSVTMQSDMVYYAVRRTFPGGPPVVLRFAIPLEEADVALGSFRWSLWLASVR